MDKLRNPAGLTAAKGNGRPASSKPAGKTPGKASGQPEELPVPDVPLPADLIIAARLSLSEVCGLVLHVLHRIEMDSCFDGHASWTGLHMTSISNAKYHHEGGP